MKNILLGAFATSTVFLAVLAGKPLISPQPDATTLARVLGLHYFRVQVPDDLKTEPSAPHDFFSLCWQHEDGTIEFACQIAQAEDRGKVRDIYLYPKGDNELKVVTVRSVGMSYDRLTIDPNFNISSYSQNLEPVKQLGDQVMSIRAKDPASRETRFLIVHRGNY